MDSMISFWQVLILVGIVCVAVLTGVFIGAYAVYRTKRETHESFVGATPKGEVFSIDTLGEDLPEGLDEALPEALRGRNQAFTQQFGKSED